MQITLGKVGYKYVKCRDNCQYGLQFQDLLPFSNKGHFDEAGQATLNGLDSQEQTPGVPPPEAASSLDQPSESHPLQLQPREQTVGPTQSTMTADDMRRAKRIRVSGS